MSEFRQIDAVFKLIEKTKSGISRLEILNKTGFNPYTIKHSLESLGKNGFIFRDPPYNPAHPNIPGVWFATGKKPRIMKPKQKPDTRPEYWPLPFRSVWDYAERIGK